ncbi:glutamate receptor U1-like isoform X2 [Octopus vulgaris]|uniref:Glutamate receptor U1-like isoform X2 n=2 Tax=Octopus TaxID=6643 RepID=A0AA36BC19_OCTVU|nr:glutamate receptor ionotropic, kainate 2 isoform X2 [Octopus sinensis]CAI9731625.1 glutamate receptor U1-like isoform X2 [Octopus vulgaris]
MIPFSLSLCRSLLLASLLCAYWIVYGQKLTRRLGILETAHNETEIVDSWFSETILKYEVELFPMKVEALANITYKDMKRVIDTLEAENIRAVLGNFNPVMAKATNHLNIPYFVTTLAISDRAIGGNLIRLFPGISTFFRAIKDMLDYRDKKRIAIIYNSLEGFLLVEKLIHIYQLDVKAAKITSDKRSIPEIIRYLKTTRSQFFNQYIVICDSVTVTRILRQALLLSMMSYPYNWLVVNMGLEEVDLDDLIPAHPNVTLLQLMVDQNSSQCTETMLTDKNLTLADAILHDAFLLSMELMDSTNENLTKVESNSTLALPIQTIHKDGCTGHLSFQQNQVRKEEFLQLIILGGMHNGSRSTWRSGPKTRDSRIMINRSVSSVPRYRGDIFGTKPLRVVTIIEPPFVQVRNSTDYLNDDPVKSRNNLQLEGFCIDILKAMSKILKFQFEIYLAPDGKFGSKKKRGWTGMIRELMDNKADVALAPFSVTPERSQVVDFTKSFMTKGTTVVVKKPQRTVWMFQFLFPLSNYVWIAIFLSFLVVSLALFGVSRVNSDKHRKYTHNFLESFWYIWGTLLRGSLKSSPLAVSSRIISSSWWLFSLIIISVYTANLAAFLTVTNIYLPIENAADLAYQTAYDYGTVNESQIEDFFKHTNISHYSKMWLHMRFNDKSIVQRVEEGLARARNTKYAFIWDSPTLRWEIADKCDLMEIGNPFDLKGYGFAVRKDTAYTEALSNAILKLGDTGERQKSEGKWWRVSSCPDGHQSTKTTSLRLENVAGLFVVVLGGIALSTIVCSVHQCTSRTRHSSSNNVKEGNHYKDNEMSMTPKRHGIHPPRSSLVEVKDEESVMNRMNWE